ncbi:MAG: hypothetical protein ACK5CS_17375, partial [Bradyrhizobium sp.]
MTHDPLTVMIDKRLPRMIDETLPICRQSDVPFACLLEVGVNRPHFVWIESSSSPPDIDRNLFVTSSPSAPASSTSVHSDLLDQSALTALAQRLVEAARKAGADAADAIAVRGVSQGVEVRDGRVEESERSEGD